MEETTTAVEGTGAEDGKRKAGDGRRKMVMPDLSVKKDPNERASLTQTRPSRWLL